MIGDSDVQHLVDQIKGGQYRNRLRLISFKDLSDLWQLKVDVEEVAGKDQAAGRIQSVLLPIESVNVGNFVQLILEIAALKTVEAVDSGGTTPDTVIFQCSVSLGKRQSCTAFSAITLTGRPLASLLWHWLMRIGSRRIG